MVMLDKEDPCTEREFLSIHWTVLPDIDGIECIGSCNGFQLTFEVDDYADYLADLHIMATYETPDCGTRIVTEVLRVSVPNDLQGRIVQRQQVADSDITLLNLKELADGLYWLTVETNLGMYTNKVAKLMR